MGVWQYFDTTLVFTLTIGVLFIPILKRIFTKLLVNRNQKTSIYSLDHGRLHLKLPTPLWMNMGYWEDSTTLSSACQRLLEEVIATAGLDRKRDDHAHAKGTHKSRCLLDLGFGCGDQTFALMSAAPISSRNDPDDLVSTGKVRLFDAYVGLTIDKIQFQHTQRATQDMAQTMTQDSRSRSPAWAGPVSLFCADASNPDAWNDDLRRSIDAAVEATHERWVLALDTAYHFSPSRWPVIRYACQELKASFMAFDLCLSPRASPTQKLVLRILTALMVAPWANFVTADQYEARLRDAGYSETEIVVRDISEHVFEPLAAFLEVQGRGLRGIGFGLGGFEVARRLFAWWGRSGVVRGVIVVAKYAEQK